MDSTDLAILIFIGMIGLYRAFKMFLNYRLKMAGKEEIAEQD
jgi:hypothetical protein